MSGTDTVWELNEGESVWARPESVPDGQYALLVLLRVRDEELVLEDTLTHLAGFADLIVVYEDASTDSTRAILRSHPKVALIIQNDQWQTGVDNRLLSETRHRGLLLQEAQRRFNFRWCMCCDADERYIGPIADYVREARDDQPDAIRIQLFDAYMTADDAAPYQQGTRLENFRKYFGPERRDILMLWKNKPGAGFVGLDAREPKVPGSVEVKFFCQHYGKSLSYQHWEDTCAYYVDNFPWDPYGVKWDARRGKAMHIGSDFGRPLYAWGPALFAHAITQF